MTQLRLSTGKGIAAGQGALAMSRRTPRAPGVLGRDGKRLDGRWRAQGKHLVRA